MAHGSEYATCEYLPGTHMTDLRRLRTKAERPAHGPAEQHDPLLRGIRILVVDDDLGVCQSLRDLLTQEGCEVVVATGGREALARLETTAVDLVLSDVVMPDLDGYQVFQEVRRRHAGLPVVLMTAFTSTRTTSSSAASSPARRRRLQEAHRPPKLRDIIKRHARRPQAAAG
jgi:CheY-like chemotaxis protein